MTEAAVIVDALRTPMGRGKPDGGLAGLHPVDLLAALLKETVQRHDLDPGLVDDVMIGCVSQSGEQSATPGRMALLAAGFPEHVPSTTIDRKCGSSQQAVHFAAQSIMAGANQLVIAGGVESMSRVPMGSARMGQDPFGQGVSERYAPGLVSQGVAAELVASRYQLDRDTLDQYSAQSHQRAAAHREAGAFRDEIVPVTLPDGRVLSEDETIRPATTAERLSELRPSFQDDALKQRFPEINWSITAGNASQITDGASALLIMSESLANKLGLKPLARFVSFDVCGDSPLTMLTAPIPSSKRALQKASMNVDQIDHFEVNEAFAPVPLAWQKELGADPQRLNPRGGAIALGHPLGASGARLMTTLVHALGQNGQRYGLQTMCEAGGMANTTIIERL